MRIALFAGLLLGALSLLQLQAPAAPRQLTLKQAWERATQENIELVIARSTLKQAHLSFHEAGAAFEPELILSASPLRWTGQESLARYQPQGKLMGSVATQAGTTLDLELSKRAPDTLGNDTSCTLTLSQQLWPWPTTRADVLALESSRLSLTSEQAHLAGEIEALKVEVLDSYYTALQAGAQMQLRELELAYAQEEQALINSQYQQSAAGKLDFLQAEARQMSAAYALLQSRHSKTRAMTTLKGLIGVPTSEPIHLQPSSSEYSTLHIPVGAAQEEALSHSRTIQEQKRAIQQHQLTLANRQSALSPSLDISVGWAYSGPASVDSSYEAALVLIVPLVDRTSRQAQLGLAEEDLHQAQLRLQALERDVKAEVQDVLFTLREIEEQLAYLSKIIEQRQTAVRITEEMVASGGATQIELLQRKIESATTKTEYLEAIYAYELQKAHLYRIMGRELQL